MSFSRILVPVDYSDHCRSALDYALFLAGQLGANVDIVHIWDRPEYVPDMTVLGKDGSPSRSLVDMIRDNAEAEMTDFLAKVKVPPGVTLTHYLESGEPASAILTTAQRTGADLVVIGTHGRTGVRYLLLGSIAEKLVRMCSTPVLTVPPKAEP